MKDSDRAALLNSPAADSAVPVARGRNYLYAIVAGGEPRSYPSAGIDGKDVYTITEGGVAAVVSGLAGPKIRPQRANLAAHQAVLKGLMADGATPLPMVFGTIAASPEAISKILVRNRRAFQRTNAHGKYPNAFFLGQLGSRQSRARKLFPIRQKNNHLAVGRFTESLGAFLNSTVYIRSRIRNKFRVDRF